MSNEISFMIFSKNRNKNIAFNISENKLKLIISIIVMLIIALIIGVYLSYNTNLKEAAYKQLKKKIDCNKSNYLKCQIKC